ncbi:MAG: CsgG/HfaB family protein, partial [Paludibacteraceae bacterium]
MTKRYILLTILMTIAMSLFAAKKRNVVQVEQAPQQVVDDNKRTIKRKVAIGRFSNETQYGKGIFYDKANDPMGKQALDILSSKLAASEKFILLERNDLDALLKEMSAEKGEETKSNTISADYLIIGSITQYGRKNVGENGVFTNKKTQIVEATVSIRLVDVSTGLIIYSDEGKGSAEMVAKSTMGVGGYAGFDATLSDKAISAAISQLVDNIIAKCTDKPWRSYILSYESDDAMIIGGG